MANAVRGEISLQLGGRMLTLRPSFSALVAAENEIGSLFQLLDRAAAGDVRLADLGPLFWHCCASEFDSRAAFESALLRQGPAALLPSYRALLEAVFGQA